MKVHLIGCWQNLGAVCFWQPIPSGLNLVVAAVLRDSLCVVSLLPCVADCYILYIVCSVERFVLTSLNEDYYYYYYDELQLRVQKAHFALYVCDCCDRLTWRRQGRWWRVIHNGTSRMTRMRTRRKTTTPTPNPIFLPTTKCRTITEQLTEWRFGSMCGQCWGAGSVCIYGITWCDWQTELWVWIPDVLLQVMILGKLFSLAWQIHNYRWCIEWQFIGLYVSGSSDSLGVMLVCNYGIMCWPCKREVVCLWRDSLVQFVHISLPGVSKVRSVRM